MLLSRISGFRKYLGAGGRRTLVAVFGLVVAVFGVVVAVSCVVVAVVVAVVVVVVRFFEDFSVMDTGRRFEFSVMDAGDRSIVSGVAFFEFPVMDTGNLGS